MEIKLGQMIWVRCQIIETREHATRGKSFMVIPRSTTAASFTQPQEVKEEDIESSH